MYNPFLYSLPLGTDQYFHPVEYPYRYRKLYENHNDDENRQSEWADLLVKLNPNNEDIGASVYKGRYNFDDDSEENSEVMRNRLIAYHQLDAFPLYLVKPTESAAYHKFLVSIFSSVLAYIIVVIIISHHHSVGALQSQGYCQQGTWAAIDADDLAVYNTRTMARSQGKCTIMSILSSGQLSHPT